MEKIIVIRKSLYDELAKEYNVVAKSKYIKREGTPGHYKYWYRNPDGSITIRGTDANGKKTKMKGHEDKKSKHQYGFNVGDKVIFNDKGVEREGSIGGFDKKGKVVIVNGGISYIRNVSDIKEKSKNSDGTIPASKFNANDYKKSFTDTKCTNDVDGIKYVYSLLGKEGSTTQAQVESKLNEQTKRMKNGDTRTRNMVNGEYTPEREKLHIQIIKKILNPEKIAACKPKNGEKPKYIMFGGRGGSGKSWFTDKKRAAAEGRKVMFDSDNFLILDADELKKELPEFKGWNAGEVHEESSDLMKRIKSKAMELGLNVIIDGTMNYNPNKPDKVRNEMLAAKNKGYSLEAHYMFLPLQDSCIRAFNRFKTKKGDYSGRLVPTDIMLAMQDNEKSFDSVKDIVDDWSFRDNRGSGGPKLISKKEVK
jgi:predicted ABC-type ATPase